MYFFWFYITTLLKKWKKLLLGNLLNIIAGFLQIFSFFTGDKYANPILSFIQNNYFLIPILFLLTILWLTVEITIELWKKNNILILKIKNFSRNKKTDIYFKQVAKEINNTINPIPQKVSGESDAISNPDTSLKKFVSIILNDTQIEMCNKVNELSLKYCKKELNITEVYENSIVELNQNKILSAASHFCGIYRSIATMFASIPNYSSREDYVSFLLVLEKLENLTKEMKSDVKIKRQIESCEKAVWGITSV